jgi:aspartate/tyrosine/aromatic aminotransferase
MDPEFGTSVCEEARRLATSGKDANQIANILFQSDPAGHNYGIGILLGGDGRPLATSPTVLEYLRRELDASASGSYMNSAALLDTLRQEVLAWQRVPESVRDRFTLVLPSDAGTGAIQTAVEVAAGLQPDTRGIAVEELGWPAYKAMARTARLSLKEVPAGSVVEEPGTLPVYQAGPMNTTGFVAPRECVADRAAAVLRGAAVPVLDRAYSGFDFASAIDEGYDAVMARSYDRQIAPFVDAGAEFFLAISPTKVFVTFALRPAGLLLFHSPDPSRLRAMNNLLNVALRARGSAFEHPVTRAFARALARDRARLEQEHEGSLRRVADAEAAWRELARDSAIEEYFGSGYAGLFRNMLARDDAAAQIYGEHLYPVLAGGRCRLNVTGIPDDAGLAASHVRLFSGLCS